MNVNLYSDDHDVNGTHPVLVEKIDKHQQTYYGIQFGREGCSVTIWYQSKGERQMAMETASIIAQSGR